jgi:prepilin-type N-terminal cleavage/methylation domain-containing protein
MRFISAIRKAGAAVRPRGERGLTLIELMIAVLITGFLLAGLYNMFGSQERSQILVDQMAEMNQDLRVAASSVIRDMRMAGFHMENQTATCGSGADGTGAGPVPAITFVDGAGTDPDTVTVVFADADVQTALTAAMAAAGDAIAVAEGCPGPGTVDDCTRCFCTGDPIIVTDGANSSMFQASADASAGATSLLHADAAGTPYNNVAGHGAFPGYGVGSRVFRAMVRRYAVDTSTPTHPVLDRAGWNSTPAWTALAAVDYIEDLQIAGQQCPVGGSNDNCRAYSVTITARTRKELPVFANPDRLRRKSIVETVRVRNVP